MKNIFLFLIVIFSLTSTTTQAADLNLVGTWTLSSPIATKNGSLNLEINIYKNVMELKATCEFQPKFGEPKQAELLSTALSTAIELSSSEIKILEEQTANAEDGIKSCRAFVTPTNWSYQLSPTNNQVVIDAIVPYMQRLIFIRK